MAHRGPRVSVGGRFPYVPQQHFGVECGSDERVPQRVRATGLVIPAQRVTRRTIRAAP
jgi:hypothetical protein